MGQQAKPFLKWAGGKGQLLEQFKTRFPKELNGKGMIKHYYEPFLGSGAVFFWIMQSCKVDKAYLNELNSEIYSCYIAIQKNLEEVIKHLQSYERKYYGLSPKDQELFYYKVRNEYNRTNCKAQKALAKRAATTIFLNHTCFNGLYRVNLKGKFNVPFGRYKNPAICNKENLRAVNRLLQNVKITNDDFSIVRKQIRPASFVYFDPPYRPLNRTSGFTSYSAGEFNDDDQTRLAQFVKELNTISSVKIMLSNSDPKNEDPDDNFFDDLYKGFNVTRLKAKRLINCNASKRGRISEILVMNY